MRRLKILTWHVHGSYLYYLSQVPHELYLLSKPERSEHYLGRHGHFPWPENVHDVSVRDVRRMDFDCLLFQWRTQYEHDQYEWLSEAQRRLPKIYLEHDPPREHPTQMRHPVDDPSMLLVHVTAFNELMWDNGRTPTRVIRHGVHLPQAPAYTGELARGLVVVNNLPARGRLAGADIFERVRAEIPLDLVGMNVEPLGGLGEVRHDLLPAWEARYRFFFHPIRYTSLGLAVCEAMWLGLPIIGLATTEMATVIHNGVSGYVDTDVDRLIARMRELLDEPSTARRLGDGARRYAREQFAIERFVRDWDQAFTDVTEGAHVARASQVSAASRRDPSALSAA